MPLDLPHLDVPLGTLAEKRRSPRVQAAMPAWVQGRETVTHDLGDQGLSFQAEAPLEVGSVVDVKVDYLLDGHNHPIACQAQVMRVQALERGWRIGVRLLPQLPAGSQADAGAPAGDAAAAGPPA